MTWFGECIDEEMKKGRESVKNDYKDGKLPWNLLPLVVLEKVVEVYKAGAAKYGPNRWQNLDDGYERYKAAAFRHLVEYEKGHRYDEETGCHHLAQVIWNLISMLYMDLKGKGKFEYKERSDETKYR